MVPFTWAEVGSNTVDGLNPRFNPAMNPRANEPGPPNFLGGPAGAPQSDVVVAWCGACWVEGDHKLYVGPGGGHNNYYGNETYVWDAQTAQFSIPPTAWPTGSVGHSPGYNFLDGLQATGKYADGRVRSYHSYGNFATRRGSEAWFFGGAVGALSIDTTNKSAIWRWENGNWVDKSGFVIGGNVGGGVCWDERRDLFYIVGPGTPGGIDFYDPNTNRHGRTGRESNAGAYALPAYEPNRDLLVMLTSSQRPTIVKVARLGADRESMMTVPTTGEPPPSNEVSTGLGRGAGTNGFVYDRDADRFLIWQGGQTVYTLTPPSPGSDPMTTPWVWGRLPLALPSANPGPAEFNGTYGRFWYSSAWRCCGVFSSTTQKMQVFALA